jgi:ABC-type Mn2+/Zn2+ transport system ATPase subunit
MINDTFNPRFLSSLNKRYEMKDNINPLFSVDNSSKSLHLQIKLENVDTIYEGERNPTLNNISLKIMKGEYIFIVGPNGAGKTTLFETICGMLPLKKGNVEVFGKLAFKKSHKLRKRIGYMIQGLEFTPDTPFVVKDVVMIGRTGRLGLFKKPKKRDWEIVHDCLKAVGMEKYENKPIGKLSGGQQQKIMIAATLSGEPDILLLDEPFSNLDINARYDMQTLFSRLNREANITVLCISHSTGIPKEVNRIIIIQNGQIVLDNSREFVMNSIIYKGLMDFQNKE